MRDKRNHPPEKAVAPPATPRHPSHSLPLLPSGPGGVCELSSRGDRRGHHRVGIEALKLAIQWPVSIKTGGERGIRTLDTGISRIHTFQACSFNHSDISPHAKTILPVEGRQRSGRIAVSRLADKSQECGARLSRVRSRRVRSRQRHALTCPRDAITARRQRIPVRFAAVVIQH